MYPSLLSMRYVYKKNHTGFTLIELLLYVVLASTMTLILGNIGVNVLEVRAKAHAQEEVQYHAQFATETIRSSIENATAILTPSNTATSATLSLAMANPSLHPTVFTLMNGRIRMQEGTGIPQILTGNNVVVPVLEFLNVTRGDKAMNDSIRFRLSVESYNPENRTVYAASSTFITTVNTHYAP